MAESLLSTLLSPTLATQLASQSRQPTGGSLLEREAMKTAGMLGLSVGGLTGTDLRTPMEKTSQNIQEIIAKAEGKDIFERLRNSLPDIANADPAVAIQLGTALKAMQPKVKATKLGELTDNELTTYTGIASRGEIKQRINKLSKDNPNWLQAVLGIDPAEDIGFEFDDLDEDKRDALLRELGQTAEDIRADAAEKGQSINFRDAMGLALTQIEKSLAQQAEAKGEKGPSTEEQAKKLGEDYGTRLKAGKTVNIGGKFYRYNPKSKQIEEVPESETTPDISGEIPPSA